jgi:SNF2 family DNA or RNA helicase
VTFLGTIIEQWQAAPALVVVPNSTITNWVREFSRWAPNLRVVPFYGEAKARDIIIEYELFHPSDKKGHREPKYHVMVTTYETLINSRDFNSVFKSIPRWEVLVVDEGQRCKLHTWYQWRSTMLICRPSEKRQQSLVQETKRVAHDSSCNHDWGKIRPRLSAY